MKENAQMQIINSTEPMPHTPQGANGEWVWDGHTTARHVSADGHEWILRGAWRWRQAAKEQDAFTKEASVEQIVAHFKPEVKAIKVKSQTPERIGEALLTIAAAMVIIAIAAILAI